MTAAFLVLLLLQGGDWSELRHPARAVRDDAIDRLADQGPPTELVASWLESPAPRLREAAVRILARRRDPDALPALAARAGRDDAAADALADWCLAEGRPLPDGEPRVGRAVRRAVRRRIAGLDGGASLDRPQKYRGLAAGGPAARAELRALAADRRRPPGVREHALHALARQFGRAEDPLVRRLADDPEPRVRDEAIRILWRHGFEGIGDLLADRFESGRALTRTERSYGAAAARHVRRLGPGGERRLLRELGWAGPFHAEHAARTLLLLRPKRRDRVERRLRTFLRHHEARGGRLGAALWWLRLGPFDEGLRRRFLAGDPLLASAASEERAQGLASLRRGLAAERMTEAATRSRLRVGYALIRHWRAPAEDRVAFAARALARDRSVAQGRGLRVLRGVEPERWAVLRDRVRELLDSPSEHVRLAAAALLVPSRPARRACLLSVVDGDPAAARRVAALLARWYRLDAEAPVAERRNEARRHLEALARSGGSDKE